MISHYNKIDKTEYDKESIFIKDIRNNPNKSENGTSKYVFLKIISKPLYTCIKGQGYGDNCKGEVDR
jgi:hypothetical protein